MKLKKTELFLFGFSIILIVILLFYVVWSTSSKSVSEPLKAFFPNQKLTAVASNSQSFFPIGIYYLPGADNPDTWQKVVNSHLNTVVDIGSAPDKSELDKAQQYGVKVVMGMEWAFPGYTNCTVPVKNDLTNLSIIKSSPALLGWYGLDEPIGKKTCQLYHDLIVRNDNHPIWENYLDLLKGNEDQSQRDYVFSQIRQINTQLSASITGFDSNIVGADYSTYDFGGLTNKYVQQLSGQGLGEKVKSVWVVLPAHSESKILTEQLMKFQAYDAIINGANGILWWDWPYNCDVKGCGTGYGGGLNGYTTHLPAISNIAYELQSAMPGLLGKTVSKSVFRYVSWRIMQGTNNKSYFFIVNKTGPNLPNVGVTGLKNNTYYRNLSNGSMYKTNDNGILTIGSLPVKGAFAFVEN